MNELNLEQPSTTPPKPTLRRLFFGEEGLRAGWSVALFILLCIPVGVIASFAVRQLHLLPHVAKGQGIAATPRFTAVGDGLNFVVLAIAAIVVSLVERRTAPRGLARYGFSGKRMLPDLAYGLLVGVVALSLLFVALLLSHGVAFDGIALHGTTALLSGTEWLGAFLAVGLFEEFFFRGFLQFTVARGAAAILRAINPENSHAKTQGFWIAAGLFSVILFTVAHMGNSGENLFGIAGVALAGIVLVFSLWRTGTLWWAVGFHTSWDWAQSCLYGTPDSGNVAIGHILASHPVGPALISGGTAGPEGSVLLIPTLLLVALVIHLTLPRRPLGSS